MDTEFHVLAPTELINKVLIFESKNSVYDEKEKWEVAGLRLLAEPLLMEP